MRLVPIIFLLLISCVTFAQKKQCDFVIGSAKSFKDENLQPLIDSLQATQLKTLNKKKFIPKFIKRTLNCWTKKFSIADPGKRYQATDIKEYAPIRQLTYLGRSDHYFILTYNKGGMAASDRILVFEYVKKKILNVWIGANARLKSKDELIYFLKNYSNILESDLNL
jgi:hypothetical protein